MAQLLTVHGTEIEKDGNFINRGDFHIYVNGDPKTAIFLSELVLLH